MTKAKISQYDAVAANNTDVNGVNIAENCPPSGMNNMGREIMAALKRFQTGSDSDGVTVGGNLVVSGSSTLSTTSISSADINGGTIDGTAIGGSTPAAGSFTTLNTSGQVVFNDAGADVDFRVEGDTDANLLFVDASADAVGIGTNSLGAKFNITSPSASSLVEHFRILGGQYTGTNFSSGFRFYTNTANNSNRTHTFTSTGGTLTIGGLETSTGNAATDTPLVIDRNFLRMSSGSGGIQFNGDTAAANALDDYEEGTFNPSFAPSSGTITLKTTADTLSYTKIGRVVTISGMVIVNSVSTPTGGVTIQNLPFAIGNLTEVAGNIGGVIIFQDAPSYTGSVIQIIGEESATSLATSQAATTVGADDQYRFSFSYFTA